MYFNRRKFKINIKKIFLNLLFFLIPLTVANTVEIPSKPSNQASVSLLTITYKDFSHSYFSKSCLRLYDKENDFDQVVDFADFKDFDDDFFGLKFFFKSKKASIILKPFFNFFIRQKERTNVSLTESRLSLSPQEVAYIFNFLSIMHKALPNYEYDYDILTNNSETHISKILHDCYQMVGTEKTNERYLFSETMRRNFNYKKINDSYLILSENEQLEEATESITNPYAKNERSVIIVLLIISSFILLCTIYQIFAYFFDKLYLSSVFKTVQIFDFLILFFAGISGSLILLQDIFSEQVLFRNCYHFFFLFPLHIIAAFTVFTQLKNEKITIYYWSLTSVLSLIYILVISISERKLTLVSYSFLPIFLRTVYFTFIAFATKKERSFTPYAPLLKLLDSISS